MNIRTDFLIYKLFLLKTTTIFSNIKDHFLAISQDELSLKKPNTLKM